MDNKSFTLDLDQLLATKFPGKKFPPFVMKFLKNFLHVDFVNGYLGQGREGVDFCNGVSDYLNIKIEVEGLENIPADGTLYTFASNHPLGGVDGVTLAGIIGTRYDGIKLMVNDFLMALPGLRPLSIPINKTGSQSRNLPVLIREVYSSDKQVLVFPAGLCSRKIDGKIQDIPWTKTFIKQSVETKRDIVPIRFFGENSKRFYRVAQLCKLLKTKFNFAMIFLPDELYRAQGKTFRVVVGKPIPYATFDKSRTAVEWAQYVREEVYRLN